ncbi:MAG: NAD(P) transhydrogenase subunit alpha [Alphaproteobacteria bacterium]|jgi:NAD(P) transhydrogenase subunit alpha|nr:NAD(P) transhydrogenase subunit alpha [Alphaproteobacteria bacterium]MBK9584442.1 NAD(P) transhydrogenase subunit alpha [Alphaproteobacteria bacterium]MBP7759198.1 NAD(P) transhydrogenase subunit alpha [Alphaproteobacteria bacterium]MBP7762604.1 NAD(P) transhydrogenase subunit alpha [Alphaproteobacteria bacterium]MBP7905096.1 NAD(P) transhydrogenase subunit alpha [Alphaproteobacteria bacterium]
MDTQNNLQENAADILGQMQELSDKISALALQSGQVAADTGAGAEPFIVTGLTVFVLACFVGYHVVWRVTPALHSPLMAITNAISSVIIVGALLAVGPMDGPGFSKFLGFLAVILASVNIFGGFIITQRMLHMFQKKG